MWGGGGVSRFHAEKPPTIKEKAPHLSLECISAQSWGSGRHQQALTCRDSPGPHTTPALPSGSFPDALGTHPCWSPGYLGSWGGWGPSCRDKIILLRTH